MSKKRKVEVRTNSLKKILKVCENEGWDPKKVQFSFRYRYSIENPDDDPHHTNLILWEGK